MPVVNRDRVCPVRDNCLTDDAGIVPTNHAFDTTPILWPDAEIGPQKCLYNIFRRK